MLTFVVQTRCECIGRDGWSLAPAPRRAIGHAILRSSLPCDVANIRDQHHQRVQGHILEGRGVRPQGRQGRRRGRRPVRPQGPRRGEEGLDRQGGQEEEVGLCRVAPRALRQDAGRHLRRFLGVGEGEAGREQGQRQQGLPAPGVVRGKAAR